MEDLSKVKDDLASLRHSSEVRMTQKLWAEHADPIDERISNLENRLNSQPAVSLHPQVTQPDVASPHEPSGTAAQPFLRL